jgi:serine/threonine protein kinase
MIGIEIYEYNQRINDIYSHFKQNRINSEIEEIHKDVLLDHKFSKIKTLNHPFVSKYLDFGKDNNNYIFYSESMGEGLDEVIDSKLSESASFKFDDTIKIIYQLLIAVNYLEKKGIILRYLDLKRIMIDDDNFIKIRNYIVDIIFKTEEKKFLE